MSIIKTSIRVRRDEKKFKFYITLFYFSSYIILYQQMKITNITIQKINASTKIKSSKTTIFVVMNDKGF